MQILAIAQAGLIAAVRRLDASAQRSAQNPQPNADIDYVGETIEQIEAKHAFSANVSVIKTADQMMGELLDIRV